MDGAARDLCRDVRRKGLVAAWDGVPGLGALLVGGPDGGAFLQSQLTCDVVGLAPGSGRSAARLNRGGALVDTCQVLRLPDRGQPFPAYLLVLERARLAPLGDDLRASLVSENVALEDVSAEFDGLLIEGPPAAGADGAPADALELPFSATGDAGRLVLLPADGRGRLAGLHDRVLAAGAVDLDADPGGATAWDWLRLEGGHLLAGRDYEPGRTQLAKTGLEQRVVDWSKGCYLGQEVVARVRTYGSVATALRGLLLSDDDSEPPPPGADLEIEEGGKIRKIRKIRKIGTWAAAGWSATRDRPVALAYLDRLHRTPGRRLRVRAGGRMLDAEVTLLPLHAAAGAGERAAGLLERAVRGFAAGNLDDDAAVALLREAVLLDPQQTEAHEALAVILGRQERFHEAIDVLRRLEEIAPDEPMVHANLSRYYMRLGDREEAERQKSLATLKRFGGDLDPEEQRRRAAAEADARREDAARRRAMYAEILDLDPEDSLALMGLGTALLDLEDFAAADEHLARALAAQRDNSPLHLARGRALEALGRVDEAADVYRAGVEVASRKGDLQPLKELEFRLLLLGQAR